MAHSLLLELYHTSLATVGCLLINHVTGTLGLIKYNRPNQLVAQIPEVAANQLHVCKQSLSTLKGPVVFCGNAFDLS